MIMSEKKKKDASEAGEGKKKKKETSEAGEEKKKKKEASDTGEEKKKKKEKDASEVGEGKKKKKEKDTSEAGEEKKKKKDKEKDKDASEAGEGKKKKKEKSEAGEEKKKKKTKDTSEISEIKESKKKEKKSKKLDDDFLGDILKEDKPAKIAKLEEELELLKNTLKKRKEMDIINLPPAAKLQAENDYLEAQIRELKAKYERLEDKFDIIKKAHKNATEALNQAHTQAMDQEEMEFMRMQLENKRNDLAEARNLIRELQKVGWSMLPPKVADESKKTEKELDTVLKNVKTAEDEAKKLQAELEKTKEELMEIQVKYKTAKENGKNLEETLDRIVADISKTQQEIESKTEEARDMEAALRAVKNEIEAAGLNINEIPPPAEPEPEPEPEVDPAELARIEEKKRKKEEKKLKKLQEKDESKQKYEALKEEVNKKEEELRQLKKECKEFARIAKEAQTDKNAMKKLEVDKNALNKEVNEIKKSYEKEMNLRKLYYNIIEDMLGKVKVYCRCRAESGKEGVQVLDEYSIKILGSKPQEFQFDKVFSQKNSQQDVFKACEYLYDQANEGFNCCCFVYGETGSGKTYTTIGTGGESEGIILKGFNKIGDLLKKNKKNQLQTRITIYMIEIFNDKIYDLIKNDTNSTFDIRRDYYGMIVITHAEYKECANEDELKKVFAAGVENRKTAMTKLGCQANQSHFVVSVSIEIGNKFQRKYTKGKVTVIKLAGSEKLGGTGAMNSSLSALSDVISALAAEKQFIPYKNNKLTMLMQDALGGGAKTLMVACVSPLDGHITETLNTLTYASRVKTIKNEAQKNTDSEEIYKLKNNIERLVRGAKMETISIAN